MPADAAALRDGLEIAAGLGKVSLAEALDAILPLPLPVIVIEYDDVSRMHPDDVVAIGAAPSSDSRSTPSGAHGELEDGRTGTDTLTAMAARADVTAGPGAAGAAAEPAGAPKRLRAEDGPDSAPDGKRAKGPGTGDASYSSSAAAPGHGTSAGGRAGTDRGDDDAADDDDDDTPVQWGAVALENNDLALRLFNNSREQLLEDSREGRELPWIHPHEAVRRATVGIKAHSRGMTQYTYDGLYVARVTPSPGPAVDFDGVALVPFATFRATEVLVQFFEGPSRRLKRTITFLVGVVPTGTVLHAGTLVVPKQVTSSLGSVAKASGASFADEAAATASPRQPTAVVAVSSSGDGIPPLPPSAVGGAASSAMTLPSKDEPHVVQPPHPELEAWAMARQHMERGRLDTEPRELHESMFFGDVVPRAHRARPVHAPASSAGMVAHRHSGGAPGAERPSSLYAHRVGSIAGLIPFLGNTVSIREEQLAAHFDQASRHHPQLAGPGPGHYMGLPAQAAAQHQAMQQHQQAMHRQFYGAPRPHHG